LSRKFKDAKLSCQKVAFAGKSLRSIFRKQKEELLWTLTFSLGLVGSFAKDCLQSLVKRILIKTLE